MSVEGFLEKSKSLSLLLEVPFKSNKEAEVLGDIVRPKFFSPPGDLGGVSICELLGECGFTTFEMKIGDGGAVS